MYVIQKQDAEPGDDPEDIGVLIDGVQVIGVACALLFGPILFEPKLPTRAQMHF